MAAENNGAFIRNIAEVPWREFPNHFGGALSKPLVMPGVEHAISNSGLIDLVSLVITSPVTDDEKPV